MLSSDIAVRLLEILVQVEDPLKKEGGTPFESLLELIRELAREGKIADIGTVLSSFYYFEPLAKRYVSGRLPGIVASTYFPTLPEFKHGSFSNWASQNINWAAGIERNSGDGAKLESTVINIFKKYTAGQPL